MGDGAPSPSASLPGPSAPGAWEDLAAAARARAAALPLPGPELEDWRAVDVKPLLAALAEEPRDAGGGAWARADASVLSIAGDDEPDAAALAAGELLVGLTATALEALPPARAVELAARWKARLAEATDAAACWPHLVAGGGWHLAASARAAIPVERPLLLTLASTGATASAYRIAIELAPGAAVVLVILHAALEAGRTHVLVDATLGQGASLVVEEAQTGPAASDAVLLVERRIRVERDASVTWTTIADGAALARFASRVELAGPGAAADLGGLANPEGRTQVHHHLVLDHLVGPTTSMQQFRAVVRDHARAGCDGLVRIAAGADGANAHQRLQNLLLSPHARADSRPRLDINADDVQAAHGAATGALDADELFYLRARGLDAAAATDLLVHGFAATVLDRLRTPEGRSWLAGED